MKVNNEYQLCEVYSLEDKELIEKELLANRISYYIHWPRFGFLSKHKFSCIFCVNENSIDIAGDVVSSLCEDYGFQVRFLMKPNNNDLL